MSDNRINDMTFLILTQLRRLWPLLVFAGTLLVLAALSLNPGATSSQSGLSVAGVAVSSAPSLDNTYALNETIRVTPIFGEAVEMTGATHLKIDMGQAHWGEKWASYETGSGTVSLIFPHMVVEPIISTQVIAVLADTLELSGLVKTAIPNSESHSAQKGHSEC